MHKHEAKGQDYGAVTYRDVANRFVPGEMCPKYLFDGSRPLCIADCPKCWSRPYNGEPIIGQPPFEPGRHERKEQGDGR